VLALGSRALRNLELSNRIDAAALLKRAAANDSVAQGVRRVAFEFCDKLVDDDLTPLYAAAFPLLAHVNFNGCKLLTDAAMTQLAAAATTPQLRSLQVYWNCVVTDVGVAAVCARAPLLRYLNVSGLKRLTDDGVVAAAQACPLLEKLDLTRGEALSDAALVAVGGGCPLLRELRLYACGSDNFSDDGLKAVAEGCPLLEVIDLCGAHGISDIGVAYLTMRCRRMKWANLTWCVQLQDSSLRAMGMYWKGIEFLSVHGNKHVTDGGVDALAAGCKSLHTLGW
jgi:hypothetical protein